MAAASPSLIFLLCLVVSAPGSAVPMTVTCPPEIAPGAVKIGGAPPKWASAYVGRAIPLNGATLMFGPPQDLATLQPTGIGAKNEDVWTDMRPVKGGFWMACQYGQSQEFILSQRLPDEITTCKISYQGRQRHRLRMDIRCR